MQTNRNPEGGRGALVAVGLLALVAIGVWLWVRNDSAGDASTPALGPNAEAASTAGGSAPVVLEGAPDGARTPEAAGAAASVAGQVRERQAARPEEQEGATSSQPQPTDTLLTEAPQGLSDEHFEERWAGASVAELKAALEADERLLRAYWAGTIDKAQLPDAATIEALKHEADWIKRRLGP